MPSSSGSKGRMANKIFFVAVLALALSLTYCVLDSDESSAEKVTITPTIVQDDGDAYGVSISPISTTFNWNFQAYKVFTNAKTPNELVVIFQYSSGPTVASIACNYNAELGNVCWQYYKNYQWNTIGSSSIEMSMLNPQIRVLFVGTDLTLILDKQGGSGGVNAVTTTYGKPFNSLAGSPPTKTGYDFDGYYTEPNGGGDKCYNADGTSAMNCHLTNNLATLYAYWTPKTYEVTLDKQSGSGGSDDVNLTYDSTTMKNITPPTRTGYDFKGYYTSVGGEGTKYFNSSGAQTKVWTETSTTLYAYWEAKTYLVTFDLDGGGGSGATGSVIVKYDSAMPSITLPTKTGYTFGGYYFGDTQYYNADGSSAKTWDKTSDTTLKAKWTAIVYDVTLDKNGGMNDGTAKVTCDNTCLYAITKPTGQSGYGCDGYYADAACNIKVSDANGNLIPNVADYTDANGKWIRAEATTLYAHWGPKTCDVTLDRNEGTSDGHATATCGSNALTDFSAVTRPAFVCIGYFTQATGGVKIINADGTLVPGIDGYTDANGKWIKDAEGVTLYAQWEEADYKITITVNDAELGSVSTKEVFVKSGTDITVDGNKVIIGTTTVTATPSPDTQQFRYFFGTWTGAIGPVAGDMTITANFGKELQKYTVYFESDGQVVDQQTVTYGSTVNKVDVEKAGYMFLGWYDEEGDYWNFAYEVQDTEHLTAKWQKIEENMVIKTDENGQAEINIPKDGTVKTVTVTEVVTTPGSAPVSITIPAEQLAVIAGGTIEVSINELGDGRFEITVIDEATNEPFNGTMLISFPIESNKGTPIVYWEYEPDKYELIDSIPDYVNGIVTIETNHNSIYVVSYEEVPVGKIDSNVLYASIGIAIAAIFAVAVGMYWYRP